MKQHFHTQDNNLKQAEAKYNNLKRETRSLQVKGRGASNQTRSSAQTKKKHHSEDISSPTKTLRQSPPSISHPLTPAEKNCRCNIHQKENKRRRKTTDAHDAHHVVSNNAEE